MNLLKQNPATPDKPQLAYLGRLGLGRRVLKALIVERGVECASDVCAMARDRLVAIVDPDGDDPEAANEVVDRIVVASMNEVGLI